MTVMSIKSTLLHITCIHVIVFVNWFELIVPLATALYVSSHTTEEVSNTPARGKGEQEGAGDGARQRKSRREEDVPKEK